MPHPDSAGTESRNAMIRRGGSGIHGGRHLPEIRADPDLVEAILQEASREAFFPRNRTEP
jgi:hypothetical protein